MNLTMSSLDTTVYGTWYGFDFSPKNVKSSTLSPANYCFDDWDLTSALSQMDYESFGLKVANPGAVGDDYSSSDEGLIAVVLDPLIFRAVVVDFSYCVTALKPFKSIISKTSLQNLLFIFPCNETHWFTGYVYFDADMTANCVIVESQRSINSDTYQKYIGGARVLSAFISICNSPSDIIQPATFTSKIVDSNSQENAYGYGPLTVSNILHVYKNFGSPGFDSLFSQQNSRPSIEGASKVRAIINEKLGFQSPRKLTKGNNEDGIPSLLSRSSEDSGSETDLAQNEKVITEVVDRYSKVKVERLYEVQFENDFIVYRPYFFSDNVQQRLSENQITVLDYEYIKSSLNPSSALEMKKIIEHQRIY